MARRLIIAGNWKMNNNRAQSRQLASAIVEGIQGGKDLPEVVLCPPFTSLQVVLDATAGSQIAVGAQNMEHRDSGAFTGEVSPPMLADLGLKYIIIGHSERRQLYGETNAAVNLKLKAALKHGLAPIVCVGETLDEKESNLTEAVVSRQVAAAINEIAPGDLEPLVIAYEPVWAIGTGKNCQADEANQVIKLIRSTIANLHGQRTIADSVSILYGGSVKSSNIDEQLAQSDIDGSLVGGASLKLEEFMPLIQAGQKKVKLSLSKA